MQGIVCIHVNMLQIAGCLSAMRKNDIDGFISACITDLCHYPDYEIALCGVAKGMADICIDTIAHGFYWREEFCGCELDNC